MISFEWFTLSNALEKSKSMRSVCFLWLALRARSSMRDTDCVSQEGLSLKPSCKSYISPFESRCLTTFEAMMCSMTLHKIHVKK